MPEPRVGFGAFVMSLGKQPSGTSQHTTAYCIPGYKVQPLVSSTRNYISIPQDTLQRCAELGALQKPALDITKPNFPFFFRRNSIRLDPSSKSL